MGLIKKFCLFVILIGVFLLIGMANIAMQGLSDVIKPCDVAIVLGTEVKIDGKPSDRLKARLDRAASLYHQRIVPKIIVSGGKGKSGFDEAFIMKHYLSQQGVPKENIIQDSLGVNTMATGVNSAKIMKENGFKTALIVTQFFHIPRTALSLRAYGVKVGGHAHAAYFEMRDIYSLAREAIALPVYASKLKNEKL